MLTEQFYKHWSGDKLDSIQCDTRFVDDINDDLQYFIDAETGMYTDYGYCIDELQCYTDDWRKVAENCCKRYGCELAGEKLEAETEDALVQTMLAIYA